MSDTPRTDAESRRIDKFDRWSEIVSAMEEHARSLERRCAALEAFLRKSLPYMTGGTAAHARALLEAKDE